MLCQSTWFRGSLLIFSELLICAVMWKTRGSTKTTTPLYDTATFVVGSTCWLYRRHWQHDGKMLCLHSHRP